MSTLDQYIAEYNHIKRQLQEEKDQLKKSRLRLKRTLQAQKIIQDVAEAVQRTAHQRIASVVTRCLEAIFDDPYTFELQFRQARGKTEVKPILLRDGNVLEDPLNEASGGVCDVAAFALRLVVLVLAQPQRRRFLVLDEPFKGLKPPSKYGPLVTKLLETLAEEMKVQFLIVQNVEEFQTGKVVKL